MAKPRAKAQQSFSDPLGHGWLVFSIVAAILAWFWLTLPPDRVALDEACVPAGMRFKSSALTWGDKFWRHQKNAISAEIGMLQDLREAAKQGTLRPADETPIEQRMRHLTDRDLARLAAGQEAAWRERILWLGRCEQTVDRRLAR